VILTERHIEASTVVPMASLSDRSTSVRSSHQGWSSSSTTNASGVAHYYFNDHLGAPILQTSASGTVVWRIEREPYGERYATRLGGDRHQPLGLPGQEYDESAPDRQYNIFRWYRAGWGRYTQSDPITSLDYDQLMMRSVENTYMYVDGNPLAFIDPWGLAKTKPGKPPNPKDWKKNCENAKSLTRNDPGACQYGSTKARPPAGLSTFFDWDLDCVCKCMGDDPGSSCVRGCIQCAKDNGADVSRVGPHIWCRDRCQQKGLWDTNKQGKELNDCIWGKCCTTWFQQPGN
jgi:RHS repeat-associated protein